MDKKKPRKKLNDLDRYIIFCLVFITIYTIVHTLIFFFTGSEAKTLDRLVFAAIFGEMMFCFLIKRFKLHEEAKIIFGRKKKDEPYEDSYEESCGESFDNMGDSG